MVIFSHRGIDFGREDNSLEAITAAAERGFSVEVDLRLKDNRIILSHEEAPNEEAMGGFDNLLELIMKNPRIYFALHIKEDSGSLFRRAGDYIRSFNNCFLFMTDFKQDNFIRLMSRAIGKQRLALYVNARSITEGLLECAEYLWLDETRENIFADLSYFQVGKKVVCCSPEIFMRDYQARLKFTLERFPGSGIFGVCTDYPEQYLKKK